MNLKNGLAQRMLQASFMKPLKNEKYKQKKIY